MCFCVCVYERSFPQGLSGWNHPKVACAEQRKWSPGSELGSYLRTRAFDLRPGVPPIFYPEPSILHCLPFLGWRWHLQHLGLGHGFHQPTLDPLCNAAVAQCNAESEKQHLLRKPAFGEFTVLSQSLASAIMIWKMGSSKRKICHPVLLSVLQTEMQHRDGCL